MTPHLPQLLTTQTGGRVASAEAWNTMRRGEILELFREHVFGRVPAFDFSMRSEVVESGTPVLDGLATRRQVALILGLPSGELRMDLLIFLPARIASPAPAFLLLNFGGNHTVSDDVAIMPPLSPMTNDCLPVEEFRGKREGRFPVAEIVASGFALVTAYCGDIDPDFDDGFANGVHGLTGVKPREANSWGSIAAWAWGLSRIADYLTTLDDIDPVRIAVAGHSRLGKTALWAGAQDERFSLVISNNSGCTGAALARRKMGERLTDINIGFPHWFCDNYKRFNDREEELPVDQHMLLALVAPRPLYVASASEDLWADPEGEFTSWAEAMPAYALFGCPGRDFAGFPPPGGRIQSGSLGYHLRPGRHDLTSYDWQRFLDFAIRRFRHPDLSGHA